MSTAAMYHPAMAWLWLIDVLASMLVWVTRRAMA